MPAPLPPKAVVFGAGATGRAHVGLLAWQAGARMVFVDIDAPLVRALQRAGAYRVVLYDGHDRQDIEVTGAAFLHASDRGLAAEEIVDATLVLTAVFDQNLPDIAETLALSMRLCRERGRQTPLNVIACENMQDSSSTLGRHVRERLNAPDRAWCEKYVGFPDCMISRVVPRPESDPLVVVGEDYNEWTVRREEFKGEPPAWLAAMELVDNQTARLERKLFMHNGGHAVCGYLGFHYGHRFIHEAVADPRVAQHVIAACNQIGDVVRRKHGFSTESIEHYKNDLYRRGAIAQMRDQVLRVVRQPLRKLGANERLLGPARLAGQYGLPRDAIVHGIVAALRYAHPDDAQSLELQDMVARQGVHAVMLDVSQLDPQDALLGEIEQAWSQWRL